MCSSDLNRVSRKLVLVSNIPSSYHSLDLRDFFSQFIETDSFHFFHFRRRPLVNFLISHPEAELNEKLQSFKPDKDALCCPVEVNTLDQVSQLEELCHGRSWLDRNGEEMTSKCVIYHLKDADKDRLLQQSLPELGPPAIHPKGNVGTPTATYLSLIQQCRLPTRLIGRLGLHFTHNRRGRQYGNVSYDYGTGITLGGMATKPPDPMKAGLTFQPYRRQNKLIQEEENPEGTKSHHSSDEEEEWDRHTCLHGDAFTASRDKERIYEKEEEQVWEKGGSGLVFYTDEAHWEELKGDFDEKTTDDWDVDMAPYTQQDNGDKDSRDFMIMLKEEKARNAIETKPTTSQKRRQKTQKYKMPHDVSCPSLDRPLVMKGVVGRMMQGQGWKEGQGLGRTSQGIAEPIPNEGQYPWERSGFGYHGEKLSRKVKKKRRKVNNEDDDYSDPKNVFISTIYDKKKHSTKSTDNIPTTISYRKVFTSATHL